jgi:putative Mg2+ transporter-C (MgtC) family protein
MSLGHLALAFVLTYALGFERDLRGSPAGDRTFSMIGVGSAIVATLAHEGNAPNALAGVITGVGFIGAGVVFRPTLGGLLGQRGVHDSVKGLTTAATIFAAAAIGGAAGFGRLELAVGGTLLVLLALEVRYVPGLRLIDGRRYAARFRSDDEMPAPIPVAPAASGTLPVPPGSAGGGGSEETPPE